MIKDIIKYSIVIGVIYTILKIIPSQKLTDRDILLLLGIIMIIFITIDFKCFKNNFEPFTSDTNQISDTKQKNVINDYQIMYNALIT